MNVKIGLVIALFSLVITGSMIGGFYLWRQTMNSIDTVTYLGESVYVSGNMDADSLPGILDIESGDQAVVSTTALNDFYIQTFSQNLPLIVSGIATIILLATVVLWLILRRIQMRQTISIIEELKLIDGPSNITHLDKGIQRALEKLREKYSASLEDYKRLSSYMTHEQKNTIAVLKSNMEHQAATQADLGLLTRLTDSVDDILTLAGSQDEALEVVDVSLICAEVCDAYGRFYPNLTFTFAEEDVLEILGKERWMYRALSNLLDNAVKYGEGGQIDVEVRLVRSSVVVKVKDHGYGFDETKRQQIFEHNYRVNGLKEDGYGIGLSVVKHVCNLCRGSVYVESAKGKGSAFYLSFPATSVLPA